MSDPLGSLFRVMSVLQAQSHLEKVAAEVVSLAWRLMEAVGEVWVALKRRLVFGELHLVLWVMHV